VNFNFIENKTEDYCIGMSTSIPDYLIKLEKETNLITTMPQMLSGPLQGRLLSFISKFLQPSNILEIGTFTGYSALCLAEGLEDSGRLLTIEIDPKYEHVIRKYFGLSPFYNNLELQIGDAMQIIVGLNTKFDLIFIDAYKLDYLKYYKIAVNNLIRKGGIIIADNVLWSRKVIYDKVDKTAKALDEFNSFVKNDVRVEKIMLPIRDGITLIRKK
jgi:predicted O-methyltransferase YrrM